MRVPVFLIPLFPLLGFLSNLTLSALRLDRHGREPARAPESHPSPIVGLFACGSVALSLLVSVVAVLQAHAQPQHMLVEKLWTWIPGGAAQTAGGATPLVVDWTYLLDPLSSVMVVVVTFVGLLIHVYSIGYMGRDPGYARFMAYMNLFMFAMLTLVLAANYLVLFVGWEGVGLCSYLLIGFWFDRTRAASAGTKAFIVNRIGDAGFAVGMFLVFFTFGSLDFQAVTLRTARLPVETGWAGPLTLIALCLFVGACGKSAQIPLHVWLPDAMEGPTPVSALIHAATMVTAGVYMVARSATIYAHAPNALRVVAFVGALTALFAAAIGLVQNDIKRVLAYSTISQLGYMFLACGVGAFSAGVFHLGTHAFFKALLFLGAGSVIHSLAGEQDMRRMGGLAARLPWTRATMLVGCVAIAGIPPLAGFFSKDQILSAAFRVGGYGQIVWAIGLLTAALTAFYMFRLYHLAFSGEHRGTQEERKRLHESPKSMTVPLLLLACGSIVAGCAGLPAAFRIGNWIGRYLDPVFAGARAALLGAREGHAGGASIPAHAASDMALEAGLMAAGVGIALGGVALAWHLYRARPEIPDRLATRFAFAYRVLLHKCYVDEVYGRLVVRGLALGGGQTLHALDRFVVDGGDGQVRPGVGVNGAAWGTRDVVGRLSDLWDRWIVDGIVNLMALTLDNLSYVIRAAQNGLVQHYVWMMLLGLLLLIIGAPWWP